MSRVAAVFSGEASFKASDNSENNEFNKILEKEDEQKGPAK